MTEQELARIEGLAAAATPGPWASLSQCDAVAIVHGGKVVGSLPEVDRAFIAAARDAVPQFCAALRDAWGWMGRRADDARCEHDWFDDGRAAEHARWVQGLEDWKRRLSLRTAGLHDRIAVTAIDLILAAEEKANQDALAPQPHDMMRLEHARMKAALLEIVSLHDGTALSVKADLAITLARQALGE